MTIPDGSARGAEQPESRPPLVLVTVGTDVHPFDRLIEWVDRWLTDSGQQVRCVIQYGSSRPPKASGESGDPHETGKPYLDHGELARAMQAATVVVCHGGPATISEARRTGHLPIVVPRDPARGEHVDAHQLRFARHLGASALVVRCGEEDDLRGALANALADPPRFRLDAPGEMARGEAPVSAAVHRAGALIDALLCTRTGATELTDLTDLTQRQDNLSSTDPAATPKTTARTGWPAVSVVVATKDRPELLRETVAAVIAQDYPGRIHCIVVFDGAEPDPTLSSGDPHREVSVATNNRSPGLAGARNSGILTADGEMVAFCDDDDTWLPGKLRAQVEALRSDPAASMVCCGIRVDYRGDTVDRVLPRQWVEHADLLRSRLTELHPSTFVLRRRALTDGFGLVDEDLPGSYAEDYDLLLRAARQGPVLNLPEVGVRVRWHAQSHFASRWQTIAEALTLLLHRHPDFRSNPRGYARVTGQIAFAHAALGNHRDALRWARRTLRANPTEARAYLALTVAARLTGPDAVLRRLHQHGRGL